MMTKVQCQLKKLVYIVSEMTYTVSSGTLNPIIPYHTIYIGLYVNKLLRQWPIGVWHLLPFMQ